MTVISPNASTTIGGLPITITTRTEAASVLVKQAIQRRSSDAIPFFATSANANVLSQCAKQKSTKEIYLRSDAIHADGMSLVFASRLFGRKNLPERVATTDLYHDIAEQAQREGASFYMLGAAAEALAKAHTNTSKKYPRLKIVGTRDGYFTQEEEDSIIEEINAARPDILWVGIGVPGAQQFCARNLHRLTGVGAVKTCGGLFDHLTGDIARAPQWMQSSGLEWLFRLAQDPRRLLARNLVTNFHAIYLFMKQTQ